jgi:hypothetical protein
MKKRAAILSGAIASVCLMLLLLILWNAWLNAHSVRSGSRCVSYLGQIAAAKEDWARENNKTTNDTPDWNDLRPYLPPQWTNGQPLCPAGGVYTIGPIGELPICSIGGPMHSLNNTDTNSFYYGIPSTKRK